MVQRVVVCWLLLLLIASSLEAQDGRRAQRRQGRRAALLQRPSAVHRRGSSAAAAPRAFAVSNTKWPQPNGLGSAITITYSYSNLLDGQMSGLSVDQLKQGIEEALGLWAAVAPLHFEEVDDTGPLPDNSDSDYAAAGHADIRFGHHVLDGAQGSELAHAFLPYSTTAGLAGDLHFDRDEDWSRLQGGYYLETALHEIGHTLGLEHESIEDAIMNPILRGRFTGLGSGELLPDDIAGIRAIYGEGAGSVTPLSSDEDTGEGDDGEGEDEGEDEEEEAPLSVVTVETDDATGVVTIGGDAGDNVVLLWNIRRLLIVSGLDNTTVNASSIGFAWMSGERRIDCTLGDGNDKVYAIGLRVRGLDCQLGDGNDSLNIFYSSIKQLLADGGEGTDRFRRFFATLNSKDLSGFE